MYLCTDEWTAQQKMENINFVFSLPFIQCEIKSRYNETPSRQGIGKISYITLFTIFSDQLLYFFTNLQLMAYCLVTKSV